MPRTKKQAAVEMKHCKKCDADHPDTAESWYTGKTTAGICRAAYARDRARYIANKAAKKAAAEAAPPAPARRTRTRKAAAPAAPADAQEAAAE
jgi:hypothetical protein